MKFWGQNFFAGLNIFKFTKKMPGQLIETFFWHL